MSTLFAAIDTSAQACAAAVLVGLALMGAAGIEP